ncbi:hypothetical protein CRM22_011322 [Opisthorchis felineus]|uniref:Ubiquitin-like domain-containing protein n=1 Tax=Opisthorchis felineus TaxID=147828 RepID=A0A4S2JQI3_OPIFE|nr:hypothetical protein CRM22_011322 [Opisthorchis felineus]TGZ37757.1 hypothetical protein CRM22_011322 [Opisthorchis felineus]
MRLFVRDFNGSSFAFEASDTLRVSALKNQLSGIIQVNPLLQRLYFRGAPLEDSRALSDYDVEDDCVLDLNCDLLGGAKKRKKKVYTTPKKIKHRKKKVKLATLKFYKVDSNGKITRLRRECPNEGCGPGVFMASHFDRQYCGKCALTYMHERK